MSVSDELVLCRILLASAREDEAALRASIAARRLPPSRFAFSIAAAAREVARAEERLAAAGADDLTSSVNDIAGRVGCAMALGALDARLREPDGSGAGVTDLCLRIQLLIGQEIRAERRLLDGPG